MPVVNGHAVFPSGEPVVNDANADNFFVFVKKKSVRSQNSSKAPVKTDQEKTSFGATSSIPD